MTADNLSQRITGLSQRIEELRQQYLSDPKSSAEILADAMEELRISIEELSVADEELCQQNEELAAQNEELIEAQSAIREREEQLSAIYENASVGINLLGLDGRYIKVNRKFCNITGYTADELLKLTLRSSRNHINHWTYYNIICGANRN